MNNEATHNLEWWKLILGSLVAIAVVVIPLIWNFAKEDEVPPQFALSTPIFPSDQAVLVYARNDTAKKTGNIHVEWDGLLFHEGGKESHNSRVKYSWEFVPKKLIGDAKLIKSGPHKVRFSFHNSAYSDLLQIVVSESAVVNVRRIGEQQSNLPEKPGSSRALVIGNSNYGSSGPLSSLKNSANDAKLIAAKLGEAGFEVTSGIDLNRREFINLLSEYAKEKGKYDTSLIYYSGHGIQLNGADYIIPVGIKLDDANDIERYGIPVEEINRVARSGNNQVVLRAAAPGTVALDGLGDSMNSPFAASLAKHLTAPDSELSSSFRKVINEVKASTNGLQQPWFQSTASEDIVLNPSNKQTIPSSNSVDILILDTCMEPYGGKNITIPSSGRSR